MDFFFKCGTYAQQCIYYSTMNKKEIVIFFLKNTNGTGTLNAKRQALNILTYIWKLIPLKQRTEWLLFEAKKDEGWGERREEEKEASYTRCGWQ